MKKSPRFSPKEAVSVLSKYMLQSPPYTVVDFEQSHGAYFHDALSGKDFLDFYTFFGSLPLGFNHPKMADEEFKEDILRAGLCKPANSDVLSVEYAEFLDTFRRNAAPEGFNKFFFISGGALAVENALKTAFDWKTRKNLEKDIKGKGGQIIHFFKAFHGRSGYTLSLTNTFDPNKIKYFPKFEWPRVTSPIAKFPLKKGNLDEVLRLEKQAVAEIKNAFYTKKDDIAGIIIEPIQGEGGDNHFRPEFFKELRTLADENEGLLIFDEVQCGMGLTGKMWCAEHFEVMPDIFCFGKKSQVCGIMVNDRVQEVESVFTTPSRINSTFGGNLVDMVRCRRYLEIIKEDKLLENAAKVGKSMLYKLNDFERISKLLTNTRGRGLMIAFDLPNSTIRDSFRELLLEEGCMVMAGGEKSIRLRPPLNLNLDDASKGLQMIAKVLNKIKNAPEPPSDG
ncbi:MAG: L-lysine 6-transaminase [Nitrospinae bacterium]|nr:L-lysine 6-transaminase [Nitrospinota bacterium]